jgi:hypothetical protein
MLPAPSPRLQRFPPTRYQQTHRLLGVREALGKVRPVLDRQDDIVDPQGRVFGLYNFKTFMVVSNRLRRAQDRTERAQKVLSARDGTMQTHLPRLVVVPEEKPVMTLPELYRQLPQSRIGPRIDILGDVLSHCQCSPLVIPESSYTIPMLAPLLIKLYIGHVSEPVHTGSRANRPLFRAPDRKRSHRVRFLKLHLFSPKTGCSFFFLLPLRSKIIVRALERSILQPSPESTALDLSQPSIPKRFQRFLEQILFSPTLIPYSQVRMKHLHPTRTALTYQGRIPNSCRRPSRTTPHV